MVRTDAPVGTVSQARGVPGEADLPVNYPPTLWIARSFCGNGGACLWIDVCTNRHLLWILLVSGLVDKSTGQASGDLRTNVVMVTLITYERVSAEASLIATWRRL